MAWQELYQEHPTHPESRQPPEPELIQSIPEKDNFPTHPCPSNPDLLHEPESISNYPGNKADETTLDIADEPDDKTPVPKSPENCITIFEKTQRQIGNQTMHTIMP